MRETLTFVRGAVANREGAIPVLTRFHISKGRIQGTNGRVAIEAPCEELEGIEVLVQADKFLSAVDACDSEPKIEMTDSGRLSVKRGKFKCFLPVQLLEAFPHHVVTPGPVQKIKELLPTLRALRPFIGEDATRPWVLTIIADGQNAYATNSNMMASIPAKGLKFQLPVFLIDELLRIGIEPDAYAQNENSITFYYDDYTSWLRSQLIVDEWPIETAKELLSWKLKIKDYPKDLVTSIESLLPFCPDQKLPLIFFTENGISTAPGDTEAEIKGAGWPPLGFDSRNLLPMLRASTRFHIDPELGRGMFEGVGGFHGVMMGLKTAIDTGPKRRQGGGYVAEEKK